MAESDSRNKHSWSAAPPSPVLSVMRAVRGATPSARTHVLNRASGHFDPDDTGAAVGLLRAAARHWSVPWTSGAVAGSGCFDASGMGRGPRWFPRAATRVVQHAGAPSRDRCAGSYRGTGQGTRSPRTAGESHVPGVGLRHRASARAARGVVRAPSHSRTCRVDWRSFDRPVQHANGAVAPDRLCDHGAAARGSFATLAF